MHSTISHPAWPSATSLALVCLATAIPACNQPPAVNPWRDDSIPRVAWSTPSQDAVIAAGHQPVIRRRDIPEIQAPHADEHVPHYPLWWEDPFEDKGDGNKAFAWGWQDYVAMPYSFGRFLLNTMGWPVSIVVTPPGTPMVSDGRIGRDHDAARGFSPDPTADRSDVHPNELIAASDLLDQPLDAEETEPELPDEAPGS